MEPNFDISAEMELQNVRNERVNERPVPEMEQCQVDLTDWGSDRPQCDEAATRTYRSTNMGGVVRDAEVCYTHWLMMIGAEVPHHEVGVAPTPKIASPGGCSGCGMAYSMFFGVQYHLAGCPLAVA